MKACSSKNEKLAQLASAMTTKKRDEGEEFVCFTDNAPRPLADIFLEHYEVRDLDYQIFSRACAVVHEVYEDNPAIAYDDAVDEISERSQESASVYTDVRLSYLSIWNEEEVSQMIKEYDLGIADLCAVWYDRQVKEAALLIHDWVTAAE